MCGICGIHDLTGGPADARALGRMSERLVHRGPDDRGEYFDGSLGLGFRRLSILDLKGGHQPMSTADGRFTIVFNGEIYNHPELRAELESAGTRFVTRSDTETLLQLYAQKGTAAFSRLNGMFAAAIWDKDQKALVLARDPLGIKPLYYHFDGKVLIFSSELRSLMAAGIDDALDAGAIQEYLAHGKVRSPRTVFRFALKLPPAHVLRLDGDGLRLERYWGLPHGGAKVKIGADEALERLDGLLRAAVKGNCQSDVPVGAFLSGGVDSSLVAAIMARRSGAGKLSTFSVGFTGAAAGVDESGYAREVARALGADHQELMLGADVLGNLEESIDLLDEPIADSAILPTFLLARFARQKVKVVLTGEGADELFAGYNRYKAAWVNESLHKLPGWGRRLAAPLARRLGRGAVFSGLPYDDAKQWAEATAHAGPEAVRRLLHPDFLDASRQSDPLEWLKEFSGMTGLNDALAFDLRAELADNLLMKVDKSTMRASLEARVPFLDKPLVEFAAVLPASLKIRFFKGKYLLRLLAERYLPKGIAWRRKHGFIVPWESWVRSPGNPAIRRLLADEGLRSLRLFDHGRLEVFHEELARGGEVDAGLFFRVAVLGLWLGSMRRQRLVSP